MSAENNLKKRLDVSAPDLHDSESDTNLSRTKETSSQTVVTAKEPSSRHRRPHRHNFLCKHFQHEKLKKLGFIGVVIFTLHLLFHIFEILIIPFIISLFVH